MSPALLSLKLHQSICHSIHTLNAVDYISIRLVHDLIANLISDMESDKIRGTVNHGAFVLAKQLRTEYLADDNFTTEDFLAQLDGILLNAIEEQSQRETRNQMKLTDLVGKQVSVFFGGIRNNHAAGQIHGVLHGPSLPGQQAYWVKIGSPPGNDSAQFTFLLEHVRSMQITPFQNIIDVAVQ